MSKLFLGIDTSAYTTSIGVVDEDHKMILNLRNILKVEGQGLRQQEAVFQHLNNMPELISLLSDSVDLDLIDTISVSSKPRNQDSSYMPVFVVGKNQAFILSKILKTTYKEFSHQENHIGAAIMGEKKELEKFLSLHISGGTTELLLVENKEDNLNIDHIGGTLDLNFGQLIDRIGVHMGLGFPCGSQMESISETGSLLDIRVPLSIKDGIWSNISGLENYFIKLLACGDYREEDVIITLFHTIGRIIESIVQNAVRKFEIRDILITGGVSANTYIRNYLGGGDLNYIFPSKDLSTDNGVGVAYLGSIKKGHGW